MKARILLGLSAVGYYLIYLCSGLFSSLTLKILGVTYNAPLIALAISYFITLFAYWYILKKRKGGIVKYVALLRPRALTLLGAAVLGAMLYYFTELALNALPQSLLETHEMSLNWVFGGNYVFAFAMACIIAPIMEEIVFRGVILKTFGKAFGTLAGILLSTVLFAASHVNIVQMCYAFVIGMVLALVRVISKNLWCPILLHIAFNFSNLIPGITSLPLWSAILLAVAAVLLVVGIRTRRDA